MLIYVTQTGKINCTKGGSVCECMCVGVAIDDRRWYCCCNRISSGFG